MSQNNSQTIEQKIIELEKIVAWFDGEEFELESALDQYEKAQTLALEIQDDLASLKNTITRLDSSETQ